MKLLSSLARALVRPEFVQSLRGAVIGRRGGRAWSTGWSIPAPAAPAAAAAVPAAGAAALAEPKHAAVAATKTIVAITACPTGIAHTYMAADALKLAAERAGVDFVVETQGSSGSTPLAGLHHLGGRCRHLRHRRRRQGPGPVRGQARHRLRRQARHQRARQDDRRGRCRVGQPERRESRGCAAPRPPNRRAVATWAGAPVSGRSCSPV